MNIGLQFGKKDKVEKPVTEKAYDTSKKENLEGAGCVVYHPNGKPAYYFFNPRMLPTDPKEREAYIERFRLEMTEKFANGTYRDDSVMPGAPSRSGLKGGLKKPPIVNSSVDSSLFA